MAELALSGRVTPREVPRSFVFSDYLLVLFMILWAVLLYHAPKIVSIVIQLVVLLLYYRSKSNYRWIAIYMFTVFNPGGLFHNLAPVPLSIISSSGLGTITFDMAFSFVSILKTLTIRNKVFFNQILLAFGIYMVLLVPIFGGPLQTIIRGFLTYSWLLVMPRLIRSDDELHGLFRLIFLFNFVVFIMNLYQIVVGLPFLTSLGSSVSSVNASSGFRYLYNQRDTAELVRTSYGIQFAYLSISGSLYFLSRRRQEFPQSFLYVSMIIGITNVIFSATRGWILGVTFLVLGYSMFLLPRLFRNFSVAIPTVALVIIAMMQIPVVRNQFSRAFERFSTTEAIIGGDFTAEGTTNRVDVGMVILGKYVESPLIGWGFGDTSIAYSNGHTGNQTMLLQFGAIGYLMYIIFWFVFMIKPALLSRKLFGQRSIRGVFLLPFFTLGGVIIIHSTSAFFLHPFIAGSFVGTILAMGNIIYYQNIDPQGITL